MSLWEVEVTQSDCPHVGITQKYDSLRIVIMGTEIARECERIFSVFSCSKPNQLKEALGYFQKDKRVRDFRLLSRESGVATALYLMPKTSMFRKISKIGLRLHPVIAQAGREKWYVITEQSRKNIRVVISDDYTKIISMKRKRPAQIFGSLYSAVKYLMPALSISEKLPSRDVEILRAAKERGYFSWPRRTNLTSLSRELKMPKSTLSYHFRSLEEKMAAALSTG
jgi:predicted DNA binding protein